MRRTATRRAVVMWTLFAFAMAGCSAAGSGGGTPPPTGDSDGGDAAAVVTTIPPTPPATAADAAPSTTACVKPPADTLPLGDDCFAYEYAARCAPYECGRNVHYFCAGNAQPHADCIAADTTFHSPDVRGFCCTEAACVRYKSGDSQCPSGQVARSCPTAAPTAPTGCSAQKGTSEHGDPFYCCGS